MYELAQLNIADLKAPLDSPALTGFVNNLERINELAERSPGFVWRLQTPAGDATGIDDFGKNTIVNMSVWKNLIGLKNYVYFSDHLELLRQKKDWFVSSTQAHQVLWWIEKDHIPTVDEAKQKLELLRSAGPTPDAFTPKSVFAPPQHTQLHMICGLPGAGKSTLAAKLEKSLPAYRYCPDEWISRLGYDAKDQGKVRDQVESLQFEEAKKQLATGSSVILENGFWSVADRNKYLSEANHLGIGVSLHFLDVPLDVLQGRIQQRNANLPAATFHVTSSELESWHSRFESPSSAEPFQSLSIYHD